ncbi:MAG: peptidase [Frankiales bacterium]|nr:peptidase [Frankiales bacterium]
MSRLRPALLAGAALAASVLTVPALASVTGPSATLATRVLTRDTLKPAWLAHPAGAPAAGAAWHVGVSIAGKDAAGLKQLMHDQYAPGNPDFHRWLTPAQYAARFGADKATTAAVTQWLTRDGLQVQYAGPDGTYLTAKGTVAQVEKTFSVHLGSFTGAKGTPFAHFVANTTAPTVPTAVSAVAGLDTLSVAHTAIAHSAFPLSESTSPADLWSVYEQPSNNTGQGTSLAAFGWGSPGTVESDLRGFEADNSLPAIPFTVKQIGTPNTTDTAGVIEWDLDSQAASGMAPNASGMTFYFANAGSSDLLAAAIDTWASDPAGAVQASGSYGLCDAFGILGTFDAHEAALTKAAAEGRSFFASTGDNGSGCSAAGAGVNGGTIGPVPSAEYPATSPNAIAVGGTVLTTTGSPKQRDTEYAWTHGGAGQSYTYAAPDYQSSLDPEFTLIGRATADVSAQSGDLISGYNIVSGGTRESVGGTSLSAPLWQGMWARVSAAAPSGSAGFANRRIYPLVQDATAYAATFTDIILGADGLYTALPGYDLPTGFGTPRVTGLVTALDGTTTPVSGGTTGTGSTPPPPPPVLPACSAYPQVTDAAGDGTQVVAVDSGQPALNQADLDVTRAGVIWDDTAKALSAVITVADLAAGSTHAENTRYRLVINGQQYELGATRDATGATSFSWGTIGTTSTTSLGALTGSFDDAANTITVVLPASTYAAALPTAAPLGYGSTVSGMDVLAQRDAVALTLTADEAKLANDCAYTVPSPATTGGTGDPVPATCPNDGSKGQGAVNGKPGDSGKGNACKTT